MKTTSEEDRGLILVNTGNGKGKTTAALGAALRAAGQGLRVNIIQFIKGAWKYGELESIRHVPNLEIHPLGLGMVKRHESSDKDREQARSAWETARSKVMSGDYDLVVLDEIHLIVDYGFIGEEEVVELLKNKPPSVNLILTGRRAPQTIMDAADTVTEMREVKHHHEQGIKAQRGIEF